MLQGYISLHRCIQENKLWQIKPFDKARAWIDLLVLANYKDNEFLLGNETITVLAGSFITSELKLMERWGWSKTKLRSYLKMLESDLMIEKKSDTKKTTITIVNYKVYQDSKNHEKTTEKPEKDTNNKVKKVKNNNIVEYSADFEEFYGIYPNPRNKEHTYTNYKNAIKNGATKESIMLATRNYLSFIKINEREEKYITVSTNFVGQKEGYKNWIETRAVTRRGTKI